MHQYTESHSVLNFTCHIKSSLTQMWRPSEGWFISVIVYLGHWGKPEKLGPNTPNHRHVYKESHLRCSPEDFTSNGALLLGHWHSVHHPLSAGGPGVEPPTKQDLNFERGLLENTGVIFFRGFQSYKKNHTHVKKVGHTSQFLFGIYYIFVQMLPEFHPQYFLSSPRMYQLQHSVQVLL